MKLLIVSPSFIPDASVGRLRMVSLVKALKGSCHITVMQNKISSYQKTTEEEPLEDVETIQVNVSENFRANMKAYKNAMKSQLKDEEYDAVIISVGPYYTLPLTAIIKKYSQAKVILDYRDLWSISFRGNEKSNRIKSFIKSFLIEKPALKAADVVTCCDEESLEALKKQYQFLYHVPCRTVLNGYDDQELIGLKLSERKTSDSSVTIAIYGKFEVYIGINNLKWFAKSISEIEKANSKKVRILHFGREETALRKALEQENICYEWGGYVKYRDGMEQLNSRADILLAANDVYYGYGTKMFDYIFLNKPVLMYAVPGSTLYRFVNEFENGYAFSNAEELNHALQKLENTPNCYLDNHIEPEKFSRSRQNVVFQNVITSLTDGE